MGGYTDLGGITNRANSALLRIEAILNDRSMPSPVRLVKVAQIMAEEPILSDPSPAAHTVRRDAAAR